MDDFVHCHFMKKILAEAHNTHAYGMVSLHLVKWEPLDGLKSLATNQKRFSYDTRV